MPRRFRPLMVFALAMSVSGGAVFASTFTPLEWQQMVKNHSNSRFIGQRKHLTWIRDLNRDFIDDEIERRFHGGDHVNIIIDLNRCMNPEQIQVTFGRYGHIAYLSKTVSSVYVDNVEFNTLQVLSEVPEVAMIEWQMPVTPEAIDVASRAIEAHTSVTYAGKAAQDSGLDGTGVVVAFIGTGISDPTNSTNGFAQLAGKRLAGFDATNPNDPGDGTTDPPDVFTFHESVMAAMVVGAAAPTGIACRTPNDGSPANCAGIASGAKYVNVRQCTAAMGCQSTWVASAMDWVVTHAKTFNINVVNMSFSASCTNDDGTSSEAQTVNYMSAIGLVTVASAEHGNFTPPGCSPAVTINLGQQWITSPGSASLSIQVTGSDDKGTVSRTDDTIWSNPISGPRSDFNFTTPDVSALKPDIAAPAQNLTVFRSGTTVLTGISGTSPAAAVVSGAAALLLQNFNNEITPDSLKQLLLSNADSSHNTPFSTMTGPWGNWDSELGWGLLNVGSALQAAKGQSTDLSFPTCVTGAPVGSPCTLKNGAYSWDNEVDITTMTAPVSGTANTIITTIINNGPNTATNVFVSFGEYDFVTQTPLFFHIGTQVVASIGSGQTATVTQPWTPSMDSHQCIQVNITYGMDSNYTNNMTQRNLTVGASLYHVRVENPFFKKTQFKVETKSARPGWLCRANDTQFTLQPTDCPFDLQITYDAPAGTPPGETAKCQVAVFATPEGGKTRLLGGVTAQTIVPKPCEVYGQVLNEKGQGVSDARVTFTRLDHREQAKAGESAGAAKLANEVSVTTNEEGVFTARITPEILQRLTIEKLGVGKAELVLRPTCGLSLAGLILHGDRIEVRPNPPRLVETASREHTGASGH
jgi:hypothetical protein